MKKYVYISVINAGPLIIARAPDPMPKFRLILKGLTAVMNVHGLKQKDIYAVEGMLPDSTVRWSDKDLEKLDRLKRAFARRRGFYPKFWLYDWRDGAFALARKPTEPEYS